jgi:hypothetical protein
VLQFACGKKEILQQVMLQSSVLGTCDDSGNIDIQVGFEVLTAVRVKMAVFWVVALCRLVSVYQRFRDPCCLLHHGDESSPSV